MSTKELKLKQEKEEKERKVKEKEELKAQEKAQKEADKVSVLAAKEVEKERIKQEKDRKEQEKKDAAQQKKDEKAASMDKNSVKSSTTSPSSAQSSPTSRDAPAISGFNRKSIHIKPTPSSPTIAAPVAAPMIASPVASPVVKALPKPITNHVQPENSFNSVVQAHSGAPLIHKAHTGSSRFKKAKSVPLEKLPLLSSCKESGRQELFIKKLRQCTNVYSFEDATSDVKSKDIKRQALDECVNFLKGDHSRGMCTDAVHEEMCLMFSANVFRVLSPPSIIHGADFDPEEDDPVLEPSWPHLQIVFDLFCLFMEHSEFSAAFGKKYMDTVFVSRLLELFESEDPRERDMLKSVLHRVYGKIIPLRAHIRKCINHIFNKFVFEPPGKHNGIAELLEILGSVINGFAIPLKEEHRQFLLKTLIPLHKAKAFALFYPQLCYCVIQFLEKEPNLCTSVVTNLFHTWPRTHSPKEVLMLNELEEIINTVPQGELVKMRKIFFQRLCRCMNSQHFQVAERSLYYLNNEVIARTIQEHSPEVFPMLFHAVTRNAKIHWNRNINNLLLNSLKTLMELNSGLFDQMAAKLKTDGSVVERAKKDSIARESKWKQIEVLASKNPVSAKVPIAKLVTKAPLPIRDPVDDAITEMKAMSLGAQGGGLGGKMRRKSFLPQDMDVQQALLAHTPHNLSQ